MDIMKIAKFVTKRPTDKTIRLGRVIFWLLYMALIWYNLIYLGKPIDNIYFGYLLDENELIYLKYGIWAIWLIPVLMWAFDICLLRKKYVRIVQIIFGIILIYIANWIILESPDLDVDVAIGLMSILPILAGITGKCITKTCMRYREKVIKIRV